MRHDVLTARLVRDRPVAGGKLALVAGDEAVTYEALDAQVSRLARGLLGLGIARGERLAFMLPNGIAIMRCYLACARAGIVAVPVSTRLTETELRSLLSDARPVAIVHAVQHADVVSGAAADVPSVRRVLAEPELASLVAGASEESPAPPHRGTDPYCIMYTGGTTGASKGAVQTHRSWGSCVESVVEQWSITADDRHLVVLPMAHVAWFTTAAHLRAGATCWIAGSWDPAAVLETVERERITTLNMIPTMLGDLLACAETAGRDLTSLRQLTVAGSPTPREMYLRARATFGDIIGNIYGMTETSGPVTFLRPRDISEETIMSAGRPGREVEMAILDDAGKPLDPLAVGEVGLRGPQVTSGYLNRPEETERAFAGGWFHTGDVGRFDEQGFLHIVDRKKDVIISGGYNIYPKEVEEVLYRHPDIVEAAVIGVADARWIEAVHAVVTVRSGAAVTAADLVAHCRAELPGYKVPKRVHFARSLPRTAVGKFDKKALRLSYATAEATAST